MSCEPTLFVRLMTATGLPPWYVLRRFSARIDGWYGEAGRFGQLSVVSLRGVRGLATDNRPPPSPISVARAHHPLRYGRPRMPPRRLSPQSQAADQRPVPLDVLAAQVVEQPAAPPDPLEPAATGGVVLFVGLQDLCE